MAEDKKVNDVMEVLKPILASKYADLNEAALRKIEMSIEQGVYDGDFADPNEYQNELAITVTTVKEAMTQDGVSWKAEETEAKAPYSGKPQGKKKKNLGPSSTRPTVKDPEKERPANLLASALAAERDAERQAALAEQARKKTVVDADLGRPAAASGDAATASRAAQASLNSAAVAVNASTAAEAAGAPSGVQNKINQAANSAVAASTAAEGSADSAQSTATGGGGGSAASGGSGSTSGTTYLKPERPHMGQRLADYLVEVFSTVDGSIGAKKDDAMLKKDYYTELDNIHFLCAAAFVTAGVGRADTKGSPDSMVESFGNVLNCMGFRMSTHEDPPVLYHDSRVVLDENVSNWHLLVLTKFARVIVAGPTRYPKAEALYAALVGHLDGLGPFFARNGFVRNEVDAYLSSESGDLDVDWAAIAANIGLGDIVSSSGGGSGPVGAPLVPVSNPSAVLVRRREFVPSTDTPSRGYTGETNRSTTAPSGFGYPGPASAATGTPVPSASSSVGVASKGVSTDLYGDDLNLDEEEL